MQNDVSFLGYIVLHNVLSISDLRNTLQAGAPGGAGVGARNEGLRCLRVQSKNSASGLQAWNVTVREREHYSA